MALPNIATRYAFFTGKGGVGKTSLSCATGIALAGSGRRVLIVSTDPASNLDEVLEVSLGSTPTAIPRVSGLFALNIDPEAAASAYRERMVAPYRGLLPPAALRSMEEQFSGACTLEIAAFDEFSALLGEPGRTADFDHVIFDTAPTGHTLRLLSLPSAWDGFIGASTGGASWLADPEQTTVVLVSRPETAALREAARTAGELAGLGIGHQVLAINGVFQAATPGDRIADAMSRRGHEAMAAMPEQLSRLPRFNLPFRPRGTVGIAALRGLSEPSPSSAGRSAAPAPAPADVPTLTMLISELEAAGHGVIMTMGKGGVGKTTLAAAIASELARRGHPVLLSTTDPAAHVAGTVNEPVPGLSVSRIDPVAEVDAYRQEVLRKAGSSLDERGRALLEEDLRSPCTEEIAVFRAFARTVDAGADGFVVLDTAPTGHTILLLDAAEAYHREVLRVRGEMPEAVRQLLPRLRDPAFTRVIVTTLAEATPVHEAERLQRDLLRAGIQPYAWVINQSLLASGTHDPVLVERGRHEIPFIRRVTAELAPRCALVPWVPEPLVGAAGLARITGLAA